MNPPRPAHRRSADGKQKNKDLISERLLCCYREEEQEDFFSDNDNDSDNSCYDDEMDSKHVLIETYKDEDKLVKQGVDLFGELQIKGKMVFKEYHGKPDKTLRVLL